MSTLAKCIELSNIHSAEAIKLQKIAKSYRDEGFKAQESNELAVKDVIQELEKERSVIISQIKKQITAVPKKKPTKVVAKKKEPAKKKSTLAKEAPAKKAPEVKKPAGQEPGFAWIAGKQKPILSARIIARGKEKGKYEVVLTAGRDDKGNIVPGKKKIVTDKHIIKMPMEIVEEKIEVEITPEGKEITVALTKKEEAAVTPKQQKEYLMAEIDKAIENAPKVELFKAFFSKNDKFTEIQERTAKQAEKYGTVMIRVPDDGAFTILDTKQSLEEFKKKARAFPATLPKPKKAVAPTRKVPVKEAIGPLRRITGTDKYFSDGALIVTGKPPARSKYDKSKKAISKEHIEGILASKTKPIDLKFYAFMDPDFGEGVALTPIPSALETADYSLLAVFQTKTGELFYYNQLRLNVITQKFPDAVYGVREDGMLVAYVNKKPVAVLMGLEVPEGSGVEMAVKQGFIKAPAVEKGEISEKIQHYSVSEAKVKMPTREVVDVDISDLFPTPVPVSTGPAIRMATTGYIASDGNIVRNAEDVAALLAPIRKYAQELLYGITADKDGVVLEIHKYSKGTGTALQLRTTELLGHALAMPEAATYYFVHNHPSGRTEVSNEDLQVSNQIERILGLKNIKTTSLVIAGTHYAEFDAMGKVPRGAKDIRPTIKKTTLPVKERLKRSGFVMPEHKAIRNSKDVINFLNSEYNNADGFLLLDVGQRVIEFVDYPVGESAVDVATMLISKASASGAVGMIFNSPTMPISKGGRASFLKEFAEVVGDSLNILDIIEQGQSLADAGLLSHTIQPLTNYQQSIEAINDGYSDAISKIEEQGPLFLKRPTAVAKGVFTALELQKEVDAITGRWKNAPEVKVVQHQSELPANILAKVGKGIIVDGVYFRGKVHIVADNQASIESTIQTLLHESFGHYGLRSLLGAEFGRVMQEVYLAKSMDIGKVAKEYGYDVTKTVDRALASEEWLAREAVNNPSSGWVQKVVELIKKFVRKLMPSVAATDTMVFDLLEAARGYVERGVPKMSDGLGAYFNLPGYIKTETAERFYSQVVRTVQDKMPAKMQASAVLPWLKKQTGIKTAELEWMDVEGILEGKKFVGKDELVGLLEENQVVVEEVERDKAGTEKIIEEVARARFDEEFDLDDHLGGIGYKREEAENAWKDNNHQIWVSTGETKNKFDDFEEFEDSVTQLDVDDIFTAEEISDMTEDAWTDQAMDNYVAAEIERRRAEGEGEGVAKFAEYQLEGEKENYRELLFTLPHVEGTFKSTHFPDEKNLFAHVRFNERTGVDGNRVLFLEELQSDHSSEYRKQLANIEKSVTNDFKAIVKNMTKTGALKEIC